MQLSLFSQPQPSPSLSAAGELQTGAVGDVFELCVLEFVPAGLVVVACTTQLSLFSQPQPSPSSSVAALEQTGCTANVVLEAISSIDAVRSW